MRRRKMRPLISVCAGCYDKNNLDNGGWWKMNIINQIYIIQDLIQFLLLFNPQSGSRRRLTWTYPIADVVTMSWVGTWSGFKTRKYAYQYAIERKQLKEPH